MGKLRWEWVTYRLDKLKVSGKPLKGLKMRSAGSGVAVDGFNQYLGDNWTGLGDGTRCVKRRM